jgi:two-component system, NarL family, nitrate/nitrite response regulator NarL
MAADPVASGTVRTCVVSDVRIYRDGIVAALVNAPGVTCAGIAHLGLDGVNQVLSERPDVVVVDMGAREALTLVRALRRAIPEARIVAFGVDESESEVIACAEAGVAGYVCRESSVEAVVDIVRRAANDELVCSPRIAASLFRRIASLSERAASPADALTLREQQVLALIRDGLGNKEIADQLRISLATVKNHVHNVLEKLHVTRRAQAARVDVGPARRRFG